jgi:predicted RNA-binding Zn-ribbon protein involved in translation (DUF1610 family)
MKSYKSGITTSSPTTPALPQQCVTCHTPLKYTDTTIGTDERWDHFVCPTCQHQFKYCHRTRTLSPVLPERAAD